MAESKRMSRSTYTSQNAGSYPDQLCIADRSFEKAADLRYGTNPHQTAAFYKPEGGNNVIGDMRVCKSGKNGLSQTNLEDISFALNICKYFDTPAFACMKHVNPCGAATGVGGEPLAKIYKKARDCDPRAAFGCVVGSNNKIDVETAKEIMGTFVECVVAPDFEQEALDVFNDGERFKRNKHIRVIQCGDPRNLPHFTGDAVEGYQTIKTLHDGSIVVADPLLTQVKRPDDLKKAVGQYKNDGEVESQIQPTSEESRDMLTAWYVSLSVRSNSVVFVRNGGTLAVGTGEQDRVGAVEQAVWKYRNKYNGEASMEGAVMASDGFFPFADAIETAAEWGVKAVVAPAGSLRDAEVIQRANEVNIALRHAPDRVFSHH